MSDDDLLLAAFYDDSQYSALKDAGPIKTESPIMETPLLTLVKEITERPSVKVFHLSMPASQPSKQVS
jgi:oxaloacetate decarboxylase alpha subunit